MKNKRILISFGLIAALLLYLLLTGNSKKSENIPEIEGWESIDEITIKDEYDSVRLHKKEEKWVINEEGYPADKKKVDKLEKAMKELNITDFISKGPFYEKYNLTPQKAIKVIVAKEGKVKRDVLIGKRSSTQRNTYIKFADEDGVFLASGSLTDEYTKDVEDLRDMGIYTLTDSSVESLQLKYKGKKLTFQKIREEVKEEEIKKTDKDKDKKAEKKKTVEKWICGEYKKVNLEKRSVEALVKAFSSVKANSYPKLKKENVKGNLCILIGKLFNREVELIIHKEDKEGNYICTSSESPYVFTLRDWNAKKFFKKLADFKEKEKKKETQ